LGVGGLGVGRPGVKGWASKAGCGRGVGQKPQTWRVAGNGALHREVRGEIVSFQNFLERAAEFHLWAPNRP
jgi:hypothetical protein